MKIILFAIAFLPAIVMGQRKQPKPPDHAPTEKEMKEAAKQSRCVHLNLFTAKQRRAFFPFNQNYTIRLITYDHNFEDPAYLPVANDTIIGSKLRSIETLSESGIDSLTDVMYNMGYPRNSTELRIANPGSKCIFNPRNAVLFTDENGRIKQYIAICFHCHQVFYSSKKFRGTEYCEQKFELIKQYFISQGLKVGVVQ